MAEALKTGAPLVFTYHHNHIEAYYPVAVAILDAGLTCSASLPCPAEMGASIHISGTGSSIIDTVFVCRGTGTMKRSWLADSPDEVAQLIKADVEQLKAGHIKPTLGDLRCIAFGHLIRLAVWALRAEWSNTKPAETRIEKVSNWLQQFGGWSEIETILQDNHMETKQNGPLMAVHEKVEEYGIRYANISF